MEDEHIDMSAVEHGHHVHPDNIVKEYDKLAGVIVGILVAAILLTLIRGWMLRLFLHDFMAMFFIVFAAFKLFNIEDFVLTYRTYDLISMRIRPWAYVFPLIEAFLGLAYLLTDRSVELNVITLLITGVAALGVFKALRRKSKFQCACLGNFIKLPLSTISLIEDVGMFLMAAVMIFL